MPWVRADSLKIGDSTCGGLRVVGINDSGPFINVTFQREKRRIEASYFADQQFDMTAPDGAEQKEVPQMAQRVSVLIESDLSGDEGAETVIFGLDGTNYEIDLTDKEQEKLRKALAPYVGHARQVKGKNGRKRNGSQSAPSGPAPAKIRAWAVENGWEVPERGRIPSEIREAYDAVH